VVLAGGLLNFPARSPFAAIANDLEAAL